MRPTAPRRPHDLNALAWKWMRYSGFLLIPLVWGHLILQDVVVGAHNITPDYVAARWASLGWRVYDACLLAFAFAHGVNGLRRVLLDHLHSPRQGRAVNWGTLLLWLVVSLLGLVALSGCAAAPAFVQAQTPLPAASATPVPTSTPSPSLTPRPSATLTPLPSPTPAPSATLEPAGSLQDPSSWPAAMRAYYLRPPAEWDQPAQDYLSDAEFDTRLAEMRRTLLLEAGVNPDGLDGAQVMLAYQRWAFENQQVMIFSPAEIAALRNGPFRVAYIDYEHVSPLLRGGINFTTRFQADPGQESLIEFMRSTGLFYQVNIFGQAVQRPPNNGLVGLLTGLVRLPGSDPAGEVLLYITYRDAGQTYADLVSVPLQPVEHQPGDEVLDAYGQPLALTQGFSLPGALQGSCRRGVPACRSFPRLTLDELWKSLGTTLIVYPHFAQPADMGGLESIGDLNPQRIERGYVVALDQDELVDMSLPWQ